VNAAQIAGDRRGDRGPVAAGDPWSAPAFRALPAIQADSRGTARSPVVRFAFAPSCPAIFHFFCRRRLVRWQGFPPAAASRKTLLSRREGLLLGSACGEFPQVSLETPCFLHHQAVRPVRFKGRGLRIRQSLSARGGGRRSPLYQHERALWPLPPPTPAPYAIGAGGGRWRWSGKQ